jgi:hypothetical protein
MRKSLTSPGPALPSSLGKPLRERTEKRRILILQILILLGSRCSFISMTSIFQFCSFDDLDQRVKEDVTLLKQHPLIENVRI